MENNGNPVCPICKQEIAPTEAAVSCPECGAIQHEACWHSNGGCGTPGCSAQPQAAQPAEEGKTCANCGAPLAEGQAFCPSCGTAAAAPKSFCPNCGAQLQPGQAFCPNCGHGTAPAAPVVPQQPVAKKKKFPVVPVVLGAVAVIVAIVLAVIFLGGPKVESITLSKTALDLRVGDSVHVDYVIAPAEAAEVEVTWTSSNTSVATVDKNGKVVAIDDGKCTITATAGDKSSSVSVTVVSLTAEERMVLGTWKMVGIIDSDGEFVSVYTSQLFVLNDDFTGYMTLNDNTIHFEWSYDQLLGEFHNYKVVTDDDVKFNFCITEISGEDGLMAMIGDYTACYQR